MVCQREKTFLMKKGEDFRQHVDHDHDFWKYCDYLAYLASKDKTEQNGFENIVWDNFNEKKVNWMPSKDHEENAPNPEEEEAKKKAEEEQELYKKGVNEKLEKLTANVDKILETLNKPKEEQQPPA
jgi:hypothetical protein